MTEKFNIIDQYELTIGNCYRHLKNLRTDKQLSDEIFAYYQDQLYKVLESRMDIDQAFTKTRNSYPVNICDANYLRNVLRISQSEIDKTDLFDIEDLNRLVQNHKSAYVNYDHKIVHFNDNPTITIKRDEFPDQYHRFLLLLICWSPLSKIKEILAYHFYFDAGFDDIEGYYEELPDILKNDYLKEKISEYF